MVIRTLRWMALIATVVGVAACVAVPPAPAVFEATTDLPLDEVEATVEGPEATFDIHSQTGIGEAQVRWVSGPFPGGIRFHLYLSALEEFRLSYGDTTVGLSVASHGSREVDQWVSQGGGTHQARPITSSSPHWMAVTAIPALPGETPAVGAAEFFEVIAPPDLIRSEPDTFAAAWIDFYR